MKEILAVVAAVVLACGVLFAVDRIEALWSGVLPSHVLVNRWSEEEIDDAILTWIQTIEKTDPERAATLKNIFYNTNFTE